MLQKLKKLWYQNQINKSNQEYEDTYEFIWGIKSSDDRSNSSEASLYTLNNIDITYNKKDKTYSVSIETAYEFRNGMVGEKLYIKNLFNKLTEWMISKGYDTTIEANIYDIFANGNNINTDFESLEELYATFKCLVDGFCN